MSIEQIKKGNDDNVFCENLAKIRKNCCQSVSFFMIIIPLLLP